MDSQREVCGAVGFDPSKSDLIAIVIDGDGRPVPDELDRLEPASHGTTAERHRDLMLRLRQHLRRLRPLCVAIYGTAKNAQWKYNDLRPRVLAEAAVMLAASEEGVPVIEVSPHQAGRVVGAPHSKVPDRVQQLIFLGGYTRVDRRAKALAAAWTATDVDPRTL